MDIVAENIDGVVVLNVENICHGSEGRDCKHCADISGLIHNWFIFTNLGYILIDLQDEKDICRECLVEFLNLKKRLDIPFFMVGVMERPRNIINSYDFGQTELIFETPEIAISHLRQHHEEVISDDFENINFSQPIVSYRGRARSGENQDDDESADVDL